MPSLVPPNTRTNAVPVPPFGTIISFAIFAFLLLLIHGVRELLERKQVFPG